jgi:hypothetical protein
VRYRVVGQNEVLGHEHGDEFEAHLDPVQEVRLILGGHIERAEEFQYEVPGPDADDPDEA